MHHEIHTDKLAPSSTLYTANYVHPINIGDSVAVYIDDIVIHAIASKPEKCDACPFYDTDKAMCMVRNKSFESVLCATKRNPESLDDYLGFESLDRILEDL